MDGIELLTRIKQIRPETMVILMTAYGTVETAVKAMKRGAEDYLAKPIDVEELEVVLQRTVEQKRLLEEARLLRERLEHKYSLDNIVGESPGMLAVFKTIRQVASASASVLMLGESGTGKELVAQALHQHSPRRAKPFVQRALRRAPRDAARERAVRPREGLVHRRRHTPRRPLRARRRRHALPRRDRRDLARRPGQAAARPPGARVRARRRQPDLQGRRARRRRHQPRPRSQKLEDGSFREDLYYRLNVVELEIPPLRERGRRHPAAGAALPAQVRDGERQEPAGFTDEALALLLQHRWPGNVRELENAIERAVVLADGDELTPFHFPTLRRGRGPGAAGRRARQGRARSPAARSRRSSARRSCARSRPSAAAPRARRRCSTSARARSSTSSRNTSRPARSSRTTEARARKGLAPRRRVRKDFALGSPHGPCDGPFRWPASCNEHAA